MVLSFRELFMVFTVVSLFVFSTISFVVVLQEENNSSTSILDNELINRTFIDLSDTISSQEESTNTSKGAFESENPQPGFGSLIIFAIVGVTKTFTGSVITIYNILIVLPLQLLGVPTQVANVLGTLIMMSLLFAAWRVYRVGS